MSRNRRRRQIKLAVIIFATLLTACVVPGRDTPAISYRVGNQSITLQEGRAEQVLASGTSGRAIWRVVGDAVRGDLDGDGDEDQLQWLVNDTGGSGSFYYISLALAQGHSYHGANALLMGDRIIPQAIHIDKGVVIVTYADRAAGAAFTETADVKMTKYFKVKDGNLYRTYVINEITHRQWQWLHTQMNDDSRMTPRQPEAFTLLLRDDGVVKGSSDCNRFSGSYKAVDNKLAFGDFAATRMFCEGSQEADFLKQLGAVESYLVDSEGRLVLQLKLDSGFMLFK